MASEKDEKTSGNISFYTKKQKEGFISAKKKKLTELFAELSEDKKQLINPIIDEISFIFSELKDLKEIIKRDGSVEFYQNGKNQFGKKKSAASDNYNSYFKNYTSAYKQLTDLLPKNEAPPDDGFDGF